LTGAGRLEHVDTPVPEPGTGEVLIRVLAVGLCGSDAHWFDEGGIGDATLSGGLVLGHEFCGVIESGPRAGERVAVDPAIPCLSCEQCAVGRHHLCLNLRFAGHGATDGALRGHLAWPERCLVPMPTHLSDEEGALLEPLGVALHAIDLGVPEVGASVGVAGCGPIGLLLVAALRQRGVDRIVVSDRLTHRTRAATEMGATATIDATEDEEELEAWQAAGSAGVDVFFETSGTDTGLHSALASTRPGGRVVLVGIPARDRTSFVASMARRKEVTLALCRRMMHQDLVRAAFLAAEDLSGIDRLVSHSYPLTAVEEAFAVLTERRGLKVMVIP
jgi:L-iditol 2-dehydrogenase